MKKNASSKIPSLQFYPADWLGDLNLRVCSDGARGAWIDLLCVMHKSEKYGYLVQKVDRKWINLSSKMVQKLTGMSQKKVEKYIEELTKNNVLKYDEEGLMYCKRLVKDHALRKIRSEAGKLGGNPDLLNQKDKQTNKQNPTPSSSSSSSPSSSSSVAPPPIPPNEENNDNEMVAELMTYFDTFYYEYPNKKNKTEARKAWNQVFINKKSKFYFRPITKKLFDDILFSIKEQTIEKRDKLLAKSFCPPWPHPSTWLRGKRWEDIVDEPEPKKESPTARRYREALERKDDS